MTHTYCMTSHCTPAEACARYEDEAGKHLHQPDSATTGPFLMDKHAAVDAQARSH